MGEVFPTQKQTSPTNRQRRTQNKVPTTGNTGRRTASVFPSGVPLLDAHPRGHPYLTGGLPSLTGTFRSPCVPDPVLPRTHGGQGIL